MNDSIPRELCSLEYKCVDKVAGAALSLRKGSLVAKINIKSAYRLVSLSTLKTVHYWVSHGRRSSMWIGNYLLASDQHQRFSTALRSGVLKKEGVTGVKHYLDDFITYGPLASGIRAHNLKVIKDVAQKLGVPLATEKEEGPTPVIILLGIQIDTLKGTLSLPQEKLESVQQKVASWLNK